MTSSSSGFSAAASAAPPPRPPAKTFPYKLDPFQESAIACVDRNESVLVAAHTSAGKTTVAEYAIATCLRDKQRVIYTSPIKALSNQKFRDLQAQFKDVGLLTGDVTIDPNASCLVMTTEILRSMLYRGSEVMREVAWVIFDEVHYLRDVERGVVWEESIILLPHKVRFVFLSATIPNADEFARWVEKVHAQPCSVVYTEYRPTPLQHYAYPSNGEGLFLVVDEKGKFRTDNFEKAMAELSRANPESELEAQLAEAGAGSQKRKRRRTTASKAGDLERIVRLIVERKYDPVIVFSFSKKDCELYAAHVSKMDLTNDTEKTLIKRIFENAVDSLGSDDKQLPQITSLLPLLRRGVGIHHGGLLPILKEVVEILFGEGLLKCLFATETFAMGINMPAKTVVFTSCRKFDGKDFRIVKSGEYIQMSGRAGRRGLDERGIVVLMLDEKMTPEEAKAMMSGKADPLTSSFRIGYNMLLNLLRIEDADPEFMVRNSLFMFQREQEIPALREKAHQAREEAAALQGEYGGEDKASAVISYHRLRAQVEKARGQLRTVVFSPEYFSRFVNPGRLVNLAQGWGWAVITSKKPTEGGSGFQALVVADGGGEEVVDAPHPTPYLATMDRNRISFEDTLHCHFHIMNMTFADILEASSVVLFLAPDVATSPSSRKSALMAMCEVLKRFPTGVPLLNPRADMKIPEAACKEAQDKVSELTDLLHASPIHTDPTLGERLRVRDRQLALEAEAGRFLKEVKRIETLPMRDELKRMKVVLRRLGHTNEEDVVQLKGRVACEISTCEELVLTELLLSGAFNQLSPAVCAAMLSCLVFEEGGAGDKQDMDSTVPPELKPAYKLLTDTARKIGQVQRDADLDVDVNEYVAKFTPALMQVVFMWCNGSKFRDICQVTEAFEGSIVRAVRREVELLRQMCTASKVVGDADLEAKFERAIALMQRDIAFSASLYL